MELVQKINIQIITKGGGEVEKIPYWHVVIKEPKKTLSWGLKGLIYIYVYIFCMYFDPIL